MTLHNNEDRIEKKIECRAPRSRVWRALTDHREFSEWFGVKLESPFVPGQSCAGQMDGPGCDSIRFEVIVQRLEPEDYFSYTWHPYAKKPDVDYSTETPTLVEFRLAETTAGTLVTVTESGFAKLPADRRDEAFRKHSAGWTAQLESIQNHVEAAK